jgi:hypothetical protein
MFDASVPKTPVIHSGPPPTISLHVTHLEMLWAFIYGLFVAYEHHMREHMVRQGLRISDSPYSDEVRRRAHKLLEWSKNLRHGYTEWPAGTPSPQRYLWEEKQLTEKVNNLFLTAGALMLHHELAHAIQGHIAPGATDAEALEQEKDADDVAHHQFLDAASTEVDKRIRAWSVLILPLSSLYLTTSPRLLFQTVHPHIHHRIAAAVSRLNFMEDHNKDYFDGLCIVAVTTYMVEQDLLDPNFQNDPELKKRFERASDALEYFSDQLDSLDPKLQEELSQLHPRSLVGDVAELHGLRWKYISQPDPHGKPDDPETGILPLVYLWRPIGNADG